MPEFRWRRLSPFAMPEPHAPSNRIAEFFDRRAEDYDREYHEETPGGYALRVRREIVFRMFDLDGGRVLDVGCGPAVMTQPVLERGAEYWGVDVSARMIEIGQARFANDARVHFAAGSATKLDFEAGFFDGVLCIGVIDSVPDPRQAVREMVRVLRPGGTLIVSVTNFCSPYAWWKNYVFYPLVSVWHRLRGALGDSTLKPGRIRSGSLRSLFTLAEAKRLFAAEGAPVCGTAGYYYNVLLSPLDEMTPGLALRITRNLEERRWPRPDWLAAGWILKARKPEEDSAPGSR